MFLLVVVCSQSDPFPSVYSFHLHSSFQLKLNDAALVWEPETSTAMDI